MRRIQDLVPDHAKDLRLNLSAIEKTDSLTPAQLWGTVLAASIATRSPRLVREVEALAAEHLEDGVATAARTAAAVMAMNNVYYRFLHLASNDAYAQLPARLRMQGLATHGVPQVDFELWSLAVSAVNGCGMCIDAHERKLRAEGATEAQVHDAVRVAAILHGVATVLDAEAAREGAAAA